MGAEAAGSADDLKNLRRKAADLNRAESWGREAIELNTMIIQLDPTDAAAHSRRGRCYWRLGTLDDAEADYRRVLELCSEDSSITSHIRQAIADIQEQAKQRALQEQRTREERLRREREHAEELARQERVLDELSTCDDAVAVARDARAAPDPNPDFAQRAYRRAVELDSSRLDVAVEWAALLREEGHNERAMRIYERVLQLRHDHRAAQVGKAAILVDNGAADDGLQICDRLLHEHPQDSYARRVKARAHAARGEKSEVIWHFESS